MTSEELKSNGFEYVADGTYSLNSKYFLELHRNGVGKLTRMFRSILYYGDKIREVEEAIEMDKNARH